MIGSNLPPLPHVDALKRSLASGNVTAGRIQVANATPEIQARIDESFRDSERQLEQLKARYKSDPDWSTFDAKSNAIELPNVPSLSKSDASHALKDLQPLIETGSFEEKTSSADNGDFSIDSSAVYQEWLLARGSVDVTV